MNLAKSRTHLGKKSPFFYPVVFAVGAGGYYCLELVFRGFSHWTMALCGGVCLCLIYAVNHRMAHKHLLLRALIGALIITAVEFVAGCLLNLLLGWDIWDYTHLPLNLWGQITPVFSGLWFLLCIPVCVACSIVDLVGVRRQKAN